MNPARIDHRTQFHRGQVQQSRQCCGPVLSRRCSCYWTVSGTCQVCCEHPESHPSGGRTPGTPLPAIGRHAALDAAPFCSFMPPPPPSEPPMRSGTVAIARLIEPRSLPPLAGRRCLRAQPGGRVRRRGGPGRLLSLRRHQLHLPRVRRVLHPHLQRRLQAQQVCGGA